MSRRRSCPLTGRGIRARSSGPVATVGHGEPSCSSWVRTTPSGFGSGTPRIAVSGPRSKRPSLDSGKAPTRRSPSLQGRRRATTARAVCMVSTVSSPTAETGRRCRVEGAQSHLRAIHSWLAQGAVIHPDSLWRAGCVPSQDGRYGYRGVSSSGRPATYDCAPDEQQTSTSEVGCPARAEITARRTLGVREPHRGAGLGSLLLRFLEGHLLKTASPVQRPGLW